MVGTVTRDDLVASSKLAGKFDGVLIGLGAAISEKEGVDVAGSNLRELRAEPRAGLGSHEWIGVAERLRLLVDSVDDSLVAVADVDRHQLAIEVDEALALGRPEINSLGLGDRDGIDLRLCGPLEECVV